jgi:hypothetical protein
MLRRHRGTAALQTACHVQQCGAVPVGAAARGDERAFLEIFRRPMPRFADSPNRQLYVVASLLGFLMVRFVIYGDNTRYDPPSAC